MRATHTPAQTTSAASASHRCHAATGADASTSRTGYHAASVAGPEMGAQARVLAVVPARGGSKGIPRKNLLLLGGTPLVAHAVHAGLNATRVSRVLCSTDDDEIANVARAAGAEVPFLRPPELAQDWSEDLAVF